MNQNRGINFYFSNSYSKLASLYTDLQMSEPLPGTFSKEVAIVQTDGMQKWLCLESARINKVFANFEFFGVSSFFRKLYYLLRLEHEDTSVYSVRVLKWMIYRIFKQTLGDEPAFSVIREYVQGKDYKIFQLSSTIADLFEQYMMYRPEMIEAWNSGRLFYETRNNQGGDLHEKWQMTLWRYIKCRAEEDRPDRVQMRNRLHEKFRDKACVHIIREKFGSRVSLFGFTVLPEYYLSLFESLSAHISVNFFLMNPCPFEYWFDIVDKREKYAKEKRFFVEKGMDPELLYLDTGNPLLSFFGKVGRDFFSDIFALDSAHGKSEEAVVNSGRDTLLACLQTDVHTLESRTDTAERLPVDPADRSVRIVSCYSPLREVEVLADHILEMFDTKTCGIEGLEASDILVVMPDIETLAPYIEQVFSGFTGDDPNRPFIPYTVSDRVFTGENTAAGVMRKILELPGTRAGAPDIFAIVESRPVRDAFSLSLEDIATIRGWIESAGILWGVDAEHRKRLGLPAYEQHSWRWGMNRLTAGYAMEQVPDRDVNGMIPCESVRAGEAELLGKFLTIVDTLSDFLCQKEDLKTGDQWVKFFSSMAAALFSNAPADEDRADEPDMDTILARIGRNIRIGFFEKSQDTGTPIPFEVFRAEFSRYLEIPPKAGNRFLNRGVTFSSMVPMRSIPFRVICMLGMNEENFPRKNRLSEFDLIERFPKRGDRSTRDNDLYLFLEMMLSAEDRLYISYTGKNIMDNSDLPPSRAVSHLSETIDTGFFLRDDPDRPVTEMIRIRHPLQPFSSRYFSDNAETNALFTYRSKLYFDPDPSGPEKELLQVELPGEEEGEAFYDIRLEGLIRFFIDPCRFFNEKRLRLTFPSLSDPLEPNEVFDEDSLLNFKVKQVMVESFIKEKNPDWPVKIMDAQGLLPYGKFKHRYLADRKQEAAELVESLATRAGPLCRVKMRAVEVEAGGVRIKADLPFVTKEGESVLVGWHPANKKAKYLLGAWLSLLLAGACSKENNPPRICYGFADQVVDMRGPDTKESKRILEKIVELYLEGIRSPLVFFPDTGYRFMEILYGKGDSDKALSEAQKRFYGGPWVRAEIEDSAHFRHYFENMNPFRQKSELFIRNCQRIWQPFFDYSGGSDE